MTHHKRRAYPPKQKPEHPLITALRAAGERLEEQMRNPPRTYIWLTRSQYNEYLAILEREGGKPDPDIRLMGQDTDA